MTSYIYCLSFNEIPFYIGKTENLERRIREHSASSNSGVSKLIGFLFSRGQYFEANVLVECDKKIAYDIENQYIYNFAKHFKLLNIVGCFESLNTGLSFTYIPTHIQLFLSDCVFIDWSKSIKAEKAQRIIDPINVPFNQSNTDLMVKISDLRDNYRAVEWGNQTRKRIKRQ